jgi:CheY-like chemotaxis protein
MHTLLLADDSVTIQRVVELTFAGEDVHVVAVSDGEQAIQRLETAPPDIVLADIGMPGRSGYEVARYVKRSPRLSHIPVILLRGAFEPVDQLKADEAGCDGVLSKPFEPQAVISRVQELLARSHSRRPGPGGGVSSALSKRSTDSSALPADPQVTSNSESPSRVDELDEYFDQLGAAFASRLNAVERGPDSEPADAQDSRHDASEGSARGTTAREASDRPPPVVRSVDEVPAKSAGEGRAAVRPALADAFAALLAAEHATNASSRAPDAPATVTDDIVEQVTRRVLAQLSDRVVRETVTNIVAETAERLIREEIERIKALIR